MNNRIFLIFGSAMLLASVSFGQLRNAFSNSTEGYVDLSLKFGGMTNTFSRNDLSLAYANPVNYVPGKMSFTNAKSTGFEGKVGYFLNDKKTWGVTVGLIYAYQTGQVSLDTFHMEFKATDTNRRAYRQLISGHPIAENLSGSSISVPFMLHYQIKTSPTIFYSIDAGLLYNVMSSYNYSSNATFDYEAIYKYDASTKTFVYDGSPTVTGSGTIPLTISQYYNLNPKGTGLAAYFANLSTNWGANLGVNKASGNHTGTVSYQHGSVGFIAEPTINYQLSDVLFMKFGLYYANQEFTTNGLGAQQQFISKNGAYSSILGECKSYRSTTYGINVGVMFLLKDKVEESIRYITYF